MLILTCEVVRVARQERQVNVGRQRQLTRQSTQDVQPALGQVMEQGRWGSTERAGTAGKVVRRSICEPPLRPCPYLPASSGTPQ